MHSTGTQDEAIAYCSKPESRVEGPWQWGTPSKGQGARSDLTQLAERVRDGASLTTIANEAPAHYVRYWKGLQALESACYKRVWRNVQGTSLWGETRVGKTKLVYDTHGFENVYALANESPAWFDNYRGEAVLLIDEFAFELGRSALLKILDGYPLQCQVKGGFVYARWTRVYLVSNYNWEDAYDDAIRARLTGGHHHIIRRRGPGVAELDLAELERGGRLPSRGGEPLLRRGEGGLAREPQAVQREQRLPWGGRFGERVIAPAGLHHDSCTCFDCK